MRFMLSREANCGVDAHRAARSGVDVNQNRLVAHWDSFHLHGLDSKQHMLGVPAVSLLGCTIPPSANRDGAGRTLRASRYHDCTIAPDIAAVLMKINAPLTAATARAKAGSEKKTDTQL